MLVVSFSIATRREHVVTIRQGVSRRLSTLPRRKTIFSALSTPG
jgi:hypothetical protein